MYVLIVDDHAVARRGHNEIVRDCLPDAETVLAADLTEACALLRPGDEPALIVLDLQLGESLSMTPVDVLRRRCPTAPILVVSMHTAGWVVTGALEHGANGYVAKSASEAQLREAILAVMDGEMISALPEGRSSEGAALLTRRQEQVLQLIHQGHSNKAIANILDISVTTVQVHVSAILKALDVQNRTQAALVAGTLLADDPVAPPAVAPAARQF
jgi:DNA-binding NarL/FixJ family response regulator